MRTNAVDGRQVRGNDRQVPERHIDLWIYSVPVLLGMHAALAATLHSRPGLPAVLLWLLGPPAITLCAIGVLLYALLQSYRRRSTWSRWRIAGFLGLGTVAALPLAYRVYPSSRDDHPSAVQFRLPLDGPITVAWGGVTRSENYHVIAPDQRWAYDLLVTKNGKSHAGSGQRLTDYYAYGLPILAPAAGIVRAASDGDPDMPPGQLGGGTDPCGNQVVLEVARAEFLFICHIQSGSVQVRVGQSVSAGEAIGRVGNSGNTSEPHVHLHLQTTSEPVFGEAIPMYFHDYRVDDCVVDRGMPRGGVGEGVVVEHASARTNPIDCVRPYEGDTSQKRQQSRLPRAPPFVGGPLAQQYMLEF